MTYQPSNRPKQYAVRVEIYGREGLGMDSEKIKPETRVRIKRTGVIGTATEFHIGVGVFEVFVEGYGHTFGWFRPDELDEVVS